MPQWDKEEFSALEGVLLWKGGALFTKQLPELTQEVNPWEWYTSFKFGVQ